jgi:hypothetical protein
VCLWEVDDASSRIGEATLRKLQGDPAQRDCSHYLQQEPEAQATARLTSILDFRFWILD